MQFLNDNPFYNFVLVYVGDPIPSTRSGFKRLFGRLLLQNPESRGVQAFRRKLREGLRDYPQLKVPYRGRVLISLAIKLNPKEYEKRDLDNMVKSLLDALKGIAYNDDRQVDVLHVVKLLSDDNRWHIGIKELADDDPLWHFPPLYLETPMG